MHPKLLEIVEQGINNHIPEKLLLNQAISAGYSKDDFEKVYHETIKHKHTEFEKKLINKIVDWTVPIAIFLLFLIFYNHFKISYSQMIKNTGLTAITLLGITLFVGPAGKFFKFANQLKIHRKFWGISSFYFGVAHATLAFYKHYNISLSELFNPQDEHFTGIISGLASLILLFLITITSNKKSIDWLGAKRWKAFQTLSYLALFLAILHFYLMETTAGAFVIRRLLGKIAFAFSIIVIILRIAVWIISRLQHKELEARLLTK